MRVFVCAGMEAKPSQNMKKDAIEVGRLLGQNGHTLIQGCSDAGMMGLTLNEFLKYSKDVEMIVPEIYKSDLVNLTYKKVYITKDLAERIKSIVKLSDKIVVLPGGTGTLLELLFSNESKRANEHQSEIVVVNSDGFFNGFKEQIQTMINYGFTNENKFTAKFIDGISLNEKLCKSIFLKQSQQRHL